jgi:hypothetical protein
MRSQGISKEGRKALIGRLLVKHALKQILEPIKFVVHDINSQEYAFATIKMGEQIQTEEQKIQEI